MKYQVIGSNRETGARMTLEFEAESKAAAERKATQSGMSVNRVVDITDGYPAHAQPDYPPPRSRKRSLIKPAIIIVIIGVVIFLMRSSIMMWIHGKTGS